MLRNDLTAEEMLAKFDELWTKRYFEIWKATYDHVEAQLPKTHKGYERFANEWFSAGISYMTDRLLNDYQELESLIAKHKELVEGVKREYEAAARMADEVAKLRYPTPLSDLPEDERREICERALVTDETPLFGNSDDWPSEIEP